MGKEYLKNVLGILSKVFRTLSDVSRSSRTKRISGFDPQYTQILYCFPAKALLIKRQTFDFNLEIPPQGFVIYLISKARIDL